MGMRGLFYTIRNYAAQTLTAFSFLLSFGSCSVSNVTLCPSSRLLKPLETIAEKCTNTSSPVLESVINPYPF